MADLDVIAPVPDQQKKKKSKKKKGSVTAAGTFVECSSSKFPWVLKKLPNKGRGVIAKNDISAGATVLLELAVARVVRSRFQTVVCHGCLLSLDGGSRRVKTDQGIFCSKSCSDGFNGTVISSDLVSKLREIASDHDCDLDLLRIVCTLATPNPDRKSMDNGVISGSLADCFSLETHRTHFAPDWLAAVTAAMGDVHEILSEDIRDTISASQLVDLACAVNTNAHGQGAANGSNEDSAFGLFPYAAMVNHSCAPNCCFAAGKDGILTVRAVTDIKAGTELTVSYIDLLQTRNDRRKELLETKHFICACDRCLEPLATSADRLLEGVLCSHCDTGAVLLPKEDKSAKPTSPSGTEPEASDATAATVSFVCERCGKQASSARNPVTLMAEARADLDASWEVPTSNRSLVMSTLDTLFAKWRGVLHPMNMVMIQPLARAMNCSYALGDLHSSMGFCRSMIAALSTVNGVSSFEAANFHLRLYELSLEAAAEATSSTIAARYRKHGKESLQACLAAREICLGADHPITEEARALLKKLR